MHLANKLVADIEVQSVILSLCDEVRMLKSAPPGVIVALPGSKICS
jgi:hypothetical protein